MASVAILLFSTIPATAEPGPVPVTDACELPDCRWTARYDGPAGPDEPADVAVADGRVFVTGTSADATGGTDLWTVAYDLGSGDRIWVRRHDGPAGDAEGHALAVDGDTVYVTGSSARAGNGDDIVAVAYDAGTGRVRGTVHHDGEGLDDAGLDVAVAGGHVYVAGYVTDPSWGRDPVYLLCDPASSSSCASVHTYGPGDGTYRAVEAVPGRDRVVLLEEDPGVGVLALEASTGLFAWEDRISDDASDAPVAVAADRDRVHVTATVGVPVSGEDGIRTVAYAAGGGGRAWSRILPGGAAKDLALAGDRVVVTGSAGTAAYDASDGATRWRYDLPGWRGETVAADGGLVVLGWTEDGDVRLHGVGRLRGLSRWSARYDEAHEIVEDLDGDAGRFVVTGRSQRAGDTDAATAAFEPDARPDVPDVGSRPCGLVGQDVAVGNSGVRVCVDARIAELDLVPDPDLPDAGTVPCPDGSGGGFAVARTGAWVCFGFDGAPLDVDLSPCSSAGGRGTDPRVDVAGIWVAVCAFQGDVPDVPPPEVDLGPCPGGEDPRVWWMGAGAEVCVGVDVDVDPTV